MKPNNVIKISEIFNRIPGIKPLSVHRTGTVKYKYTGLLLKLLAINILKLNANIYELSRYIFS